MGSCNSSERERPNTSSADAYNNPSGTPLSLELGNERSDGAVENRAVHEGAILGIASAGVDEFMTCGEDKALRLHGLVDKSGSFRNRLTFGGHTKAVSRATYGATTGLIYSCSRDTTIRQWNRSDTSALRVFEGHDLACTDLALSADERTLCSGSRDTSVRTWDVQTGRCTASVKVPRNLVTCLKFLSSSTEESSVSSSFVVVQGGEDLRLRVWDAREAGLRPAMTVEGYTFFPLCLDVSSDRHEVLTSCKGFNGAGCETKLWDLRNTESPVREYTGHTQDTTACAFLDAREGDVGGGGGGGRKDDDKGAENGDVCCNPSFSSASRGMVATASKDGSIKIYDRESGNILVNHVEPECGGYTGLAFQHESSARCPLLYASTMTGGVYALQLEEAAAGGGVDGWGHMREGGGRLRCVGFVRGSPIL